MGKESCDYTHTRRRLTGPVENHAPSLVDHSPRHRQLKSFTSQQTMGDLVHKIFSKKTLCIFITAVCVGCLIAAIITSVVVKLPVDKLKCLNDNSGTSCDENTLYRFYGTKTDYLIAKGNVPDDDKPSDRPGCEPMLLYLFSRHAARYPDADDIEATAIELPLIRDQLLKNAEDGKIKLCEATIKEFKDWKLKMVPEDDNRISDSGKNQSMALGERIRRKYPTLFKSEFDENIYIFGHSTRNRTLETAEAFADGLFKDVDDIKSKPAIDKVEFHNVCGKYLKAQGYNKSKPIEEIRFLEGAALQRTLSDLSTRLDLNVTFDMAKMMLRACQFDFALFGSSPWCSIFTESNIRVFEYLEDLNDYYNDGYGLQRNYEQACPVIADIMKKFRSAMEGTPTKAIMMFSHAGAYKKIVARLALFKDSKNLVADKYCESQDRKWRSSAICPFNANFYMVLYNCSNSFNVESFFNEKPVTLDGCSSDFCPWKQFEDTFHPLASDCDLKGKICII